MTAAPELLSHREAAKFLGITSGTLYVWRAENRYPIPYIQLGKGRVRYRPEDLNNFLASRRIDPSEPRKSEPEKLHRRGDRPARKKWRRGKK